VRVLRKFVNEKNNFWSSLPLHKLGDESKVLSVLAKEENSLTLIEIAKKAELSLRRARRAIYALESQGLVVTNRNVKYYEHPEEYERLFGKPARKVGRPPLVVRCLLKVNKEVKDLVKRILRNKNTVSSYLDEL